MATLTASTAFTIAASSTVVADVDIEVVAVGTAGTGRGRLIHPTLGTFDYLYMPEQWINMDGDAIIRPQWQTSQTLSSGQATLWGGNIKDVRCSEVWTAPGGLSMPMSMLRMLMTIFQNPVDPEVDYVQWWPSYTTTLGFDVAVVGLTVGNTDITLTDTSLQGWCDLPVTITYQLRSYAS
jgi:hypothetical protein